MSVVLINYGVRARKMCVVLQQHLAKVACRPLLDTPCDWRGTDIVPAYAIGENSALPTLYRSWACLPLNPTFFRGTKSAWMGVATLAAVILV